LRIQYQVLHSHPNPMPRTGHKTVPVVGELLELDRAKELRIRVGLLVAAHILHMRELEQAGIALLPVAGFLEQSWHQLQSHRLALHILSSSSFRPQNVGRRLKVAARSHFRSLAAVDDLRIVVAHMGRLADSRREGLPWLIPEADLCSIVKNVVLELQLWRAIKMEFGRTSLERLYSVEHIA
jgi:hypothetical protein